MSFLKISNLWEERERGGCRVQLQAKSGPMNGTDKDDNGMYEIIQREITNLKSLSHNQRKNHTVKLNSRIFLQDKCDPEQKLDLNPEAWAPSHRTQSPMKQRH